MNEQCKSCASRLKNPEPTGMFRGPALNESIQNKLGLNCLCAETSHQDISRDKDFLGRKPDWGYHHLHRGLRENNKRDHQAVCKRRPNAVLVPGFEHASERCRLANPCTDPWAEPEIDCLHRRFLQGGNWGRGLPMALHNRESVYTNILVPILASCIQICHCFLTPAHTRYYFGLAKHVHQKPMASLELITCSTNCKFTMTASVFS